MLFGNNGKKTALGHFLSAFAGLAEATGPRKPGARRAGPAGPGQRRPDSCRCDGPRRAALPGLRRPPR